MKPLAHTLVLATLASVAMPAAAKVTEVSERGFVVRHMAEVPVGEAETWDTLLKISDWWDSEHTWSGSAANMSIDPRAGGCFCEVLPDPESPRAAPRGGVEHMRIVYVERPRALRMVGALGPLQADAANGTMTIHLKPAESGKGTRILLEYTVGGYVRTPFEKLAPAVDGVLGGQVKRLATKLGGTTAAFPSPEEDAGGPENGAEAAPENAGKEIIGR